MLSETPSGATAACRAPELVWVTADFDRPCEMRLRGWRCGLAALVACLLVCLLAIVFVLWIRTAPVTMLTPPQARRSGPGGAATRRVGRHGQQCFLCRESRAQCEPRQRFFAARQASSKVPARSRPVLPHQAILEDVV